MIIFQNVKNLGLHHYRHMFSAISFFLNDCCFYERLTIKVNCGRMRKKRRKKKRREEEQDITLLLLLNIHSLVS